MLRSGVVAGRVPDKGNKHKDAGLGCGEWASGGHTRALSWRSQPWGLGSGRDTNKLQAASCRQCKRSRSEVFSKRRGESWSWPEPGGKGKGGLRRGPSVETRRLARIYRKVLNSRAASRDVSQAWPPDAVSRCGRTRGNAQCFARLEGSARGVGRALPGLPFGGD